MNRTFWIIVAVCAVIVWFVGWTAFGAILWYRNASQPLAATTANIETFKIRFGTVVNDGSNHYTISEETTTIPMKFGDSTYGFEVIPPDEGVHTLQFISHFPYAPKIISGNVYESGVPSTTMPSQKFEMQGEFVEDLGFDPGDPVGDYSIDILIDGKLVRTIKYTVVAGN